MKKKETLLIKIDVPFVFAWFRGLQLGSGPRCGAKGHQQGPDPSAQCVFLTRLLTMHL